MTKASNTISQLRPGDIAVMGVPYDHNSSFRRGPALAPARIREALFSESANSWTEGGIDLKSASEWHIVDDLAFGPEALAFMDIESAVEDLLGNGARLIALGGDHSITYPIMRAYSRVYSDLSILQLDAHPDLYDTLDGNRLSHACPFARIMEESLVSRLVQVGIRTATGQQREQAKRFGVEMIEMRESSSPVELRGPVYLSLDMDCLDPAFAPGVSHREPGGMSTREVLHIIQNLQGELVGADIVEFNPEWDPQMTTAMVAGKLLKEIVGRMLEEKAG